MLELRCLFLFISLLGLLEGVADHQALSQHAHVVTWLVSLPPLFTSSSTDLIASKDVDCDEEVTDTSSLPSTRNAVRNLPDCMLMK